MILVKFQINSQVFHFILHITDMDPHDRCNSLKTNYWEGSDL